MRRSRRDDCERSSEAGALAAQTGSHRSATGHQNELTILQSFFCPFFSLTLAYRPLSPTGRSLGWVEVGVQ